WPGVLRKSVAPTSAPSMRRSTDVRYAPAAAATIRRRTAASCPSSVSVSMRTSSPRLARTRAWDSRSPRYVTVSSALAVAGGAGSAGALQPVVTSWQARAAPRDRLTRRAASGREDIAGERSRRRRRRQRYPRASPRGRHSPATPRGHETARGEAGARPRLSSLTWRRSQLADLAQELGRLVAVRVLHQRLAAPQHRLLAVTAALGDEALAQVSDRAAHRRRLHQGDAAEHADGEVVVLELLGEGGEGDRDVAVVAVGVV